MTEHPSNSGGAQGSFGLVMREQPVGWGIESTRYHGTNVVSCEIVTGLTCTLLVRAYSPPSIMEHLLDLEEALQCFKDPIFLGKSNVELNEARRSRSQRVSDLLAE